MARRFETLLRVKPRDNLGDPEFWNRRWDDTDRRIDANEKALENLDEVANRIESVSLDRINNVITPLAAEALTRLRDVVNIFHATSPTLVDLTVGTKVFVISDGERSTFAPLAHLRINVDGDLDRALICRYVSYEQLTGELVVQVDQVFGSGSASSWEITPVISTIDLEELRDDLEATSIAADADAAAALASKTAAETAAALAVTKANEIAAAAAAVASISLKADITGPTGAIIVPRGTTANRPATSSTTSLFRYSTTLNAFEAWNGTVWGKVGGGAATGETPPSPAQDGDLWVHRGLGVLFCYLQDVDSGQWFGVSGGSDPASVLLRANNLSEIASPDTALTNLGFTTIGKALRAAVDEVTARAAILAPPAPKTASGIGQWLAINSTLGGPATLPAGGTWAWARFPKDGAGAWAGGISVNVDAGGTVIGAASTNVQWHCLAWRIA